MPTTLARTPSAQPPSTPSSARPLVDLDPRTLVANDLSLSLYGEPADQSDDLEESIREHGVLVPLVVTPTKLRGRWEILSGHRRWTCAIRLDLAKIPCEIHPSLPDRDRSHLILEYNRQRRKTFSQIMREADLLETLLTAEAKRRKLANLRKEFAEPATSISEAPICDTAAERRNSDARVSGPAPEAPAAPSQTRGRTDAILAERLQLGGKDLYRQARAVWKTACQGDIRAKNSVEQLNAGTKTIHAAYKDLRRRDRFTTSFRPTPYDVWAFRHDRAFGIPHPGSIPPAIVAHALHYYSSPGDLVIDPMAGGGTTLDVCEAMGRRCQAYDLAPVRPDILAHDIRQGFPAEAAGCDFIFCDPPYHSMLARDYVPESVSSAPLHDWVHFLRDLIRDAFTVLRPGGCLGLLLAAQTEKDLPAGHGYLDHTFLAYGEAMAAGFLPERRVSCPMDAAYRPQQVRRARDEGRMLGQVRDLLVVRKPCREGQTGPVFPHTQPPLNP